MVFYIETNIKKEIHFNKYEDYEKMLPTSNQPGQLYGTAKTHKFDNIADSNNASLCSNDVSCTL